MVSLNIDEMVELEGKIKLYRDGFYLDPRPSGPALTDLVEAESQARKLSVENNGMPVAIWDESNNTMKLFAGYEDFIPVGL